MTAFTTAMGHLGGAHRHEASQYPPRLADSITDANPVRFLEAGVDALDLAARGCRHAVAAATGRPRSPPGALLTRSLYGSLYRFRSSRRWEQETQRHVDLRWRLKTRRPAHQPSAHCRRDPLTLRREGWRAFPRLGQQRAWFGGAVVAVDGSKVRAGNAQGRHCTPAKRKQVIAQRAARVEGSLTELEATDEPAAAGTPGGARAADLQTTVDARRERRRRYGAWQAP
jgi:hypothetical protein